ncbi:MAG TPA: hypothetical protein VFW60_10290 [Rhodanobacteraceae bacterium]|nr:hypothetical protein [Rhodanobacteraceae bacterium]
MKFLSSQRFLMIYSGVLTLVFAGSVLMGATSTTRNASFDQITVHRINVVEPDGTMRMAISDAAEAPGSYFRNKDYPRPDRRVAGVVFMNDEGTENGGLIFGGSKDKDGKVSSFGHLSFDNYDQDQTLVLQNSQDATDKKATYIQINDRPDWPIHGLAQTMRREGAMTDPAKRNALLKEFFKTHPRGSHRAFLGTRNDHSSELVLRDPQGHPRIVAKVAADGKPELQFLDASGKVIEQFPQGVKH